MTSTNAEDAEQVREGAGDRTEERKAECEPCDYCGALALAWRKCKLICGNCHQINKSCADL